LKIHPVAKRYAKALFETADELDQIDQVRQEVNVLNDTLANQSRLRAYLFTPEVEKQKKINVVKELFENKASIIFVNFLVLVIQKGRQKEYFDITLEFNRLYEIKINRLSATVYSAVSLDENILEEINKKLVDVWKADVLLNNKVDPSILGGFIIKVEGKIIDGSLRKQLELMRERLSKKADLATI
jgi:F-type H+-transporting ATPase subunit delta